MQFENSLLTRLPKQLIPIAIGLLITSFALLFLGLIGISSITDETTRDQLFGPYVIVSICFTIGTFTLIALLIQTISKRQSEEQRTTVAVNRYQRSMNQLQVAAEIARDAAAKENLQDLLDDAVRLICERFDFYHAGIFLIDEETQYAVIRAAYGVTASQEMLKRQHQLKVGEEGIVGYVTSTGQPRIVLNTDDDSYHYKNPVLPETRSELTLPFRVGKDIIGALDVQSRKRDAFDQDDVNILQTMADLLAIAIHKANLNERVWAYADKLETRVQERTQELESERAQLQVILDSMGDGLIYDENLEIVYTNEALTNLTGYNRDSWAKGLLKQIKPDDMSDDDVIKLEKELYHDVGHNGIWQREMKLRRFDGMLFDVSIVCTAVQRDVESNTSKGAVTIIRDISQQKALAEQKSRFIANAAHELRTPLANMKTRLYLIRHQPQKFDEHHDILKTVTGRMQRLIDDLLDMSRFERNKIRLVKQQILLQDLIEDVVNTQYPEAQDRGLDLELDLTPTPIYAEIDRDRMIQVLTNLISNAINYTKSGKIIVHLHDLPDQQLEVCVEDTGIGIQPDMIEKIFQPFVRVNEEGSKGTGLGLNISREIIQMHGGQIKVKSEVDKGSHFMIRLNKAPNGIASVG